MDFTLSLEQQMLKDAAARLLADGYDFAQRTAYAGSQRGWSETIWQRYAELGLLGIGIPETLGGFDGGAFETMVVMETMGRHMTLEPYVTTSVIGRCLLLDAASPNQQQALLPRIASGELTVALAALERPSRYDLQDVATTATPDDGGWSLQGAKASVWHGDQAGRLIVTASLTGRPRDGDDIGLFLVDPSAPGLVRRPLTRVDGQRAADIELNDVRVTPEDRLCGHGDVRAAVEAAIEAGTVALLADAVGCMDELLATTVDYLKTRRQFGRTIGSFQALQHRAADMFCHLEHARSMTYLATSLLQQPASRERSRWISGACVQSARACRFVGEQAVQLHGGIGLTMEHKVAHLFRRTVALQFALGDSDHHLERFSRLDEALPA
jgi:alkylation response protein AidB-like acyl-CoA dehydrogenase